MRYLLVAAAALAAAVFVGATVRWGVGHDVVAGSGRAEAGVRASSPRAVTSSTAPPSALTDRLARMTALVGRNPSDVDAHCALADTQLRLGRIAEARRTFEHAAALDPSATPPLYGLAECCRLQGDYARELHAYAEILKRRPADPGLLERIAAARSAAEAPATRP